MLILKGLSQHLLSIRRHPLLIKPGNVVREAIKKSAVLNKARLDNPRCSSYTVDPRTKLKRAESAPPLLELTPEIRAAAALVAEADSYEQLQNGTLKIEKRQSGSFWMADIAHQGSWPWGSNDADFKVSIAGWMIKSSLSILTRIMFS
jgi:hypothetical protein